jgi:hypothetical protein
VYADIDPVVVNHAQALLSGGRAVKSLATVPARTRDQITGFFGDLTLVEPGLTDIWAWRPDAATVDTTSEFMRILGGVARKDCPRSPGQPA